jgi:DNA-binding beta-propeller fold protein YncE
MRDQIAAGIVTLLSRSLLAMAIAIAACDTSMPVTRPAAPVTDGQPAAPALDSQTGRADVALVAVMWQTDGASPSRRLPSGLAVDGSGTLYVLVAGLDQIEAIASTGQPLARWGGRGTIPGQFRFSPSPEAEVDAVSTGVGLPIGGGVAVDARGDIYVADSDNARIQKFDRDGRFLTAWDTLIDVQSPISRPMGLAIDQDGHVYVADAGSHRIIKYDRSGAFLLQWGALGRHEGEFNGPLAVAVDRSGHVYVADRGNHRIQKFDDTGWFLAAWGGQGAGAGEFGEQVFLAVDAQGRVYTTDWLNHRVQVFDDQGTFLTQWGSDGWGAGQFVYISGIAVDARGDIYVADLLTGRIQQFRLRRPLPARGAGTPTPRAGTPMPFPTSTVKVTPVDR